MFEPLKKLLGKRVDQYSSGKDKLTLEVASRYEEFTVKKLGSNNFQAFSFKKGELKVKVPDSFLIQKLSIFEEEAKKEINTFLQKKYPSAEKLTSISYEIKPAE